MKKYNFDTQIDPSADPEKLSGIDSATIKKETEKDLLRLTTSVALNIDVFPIGQSKPTYKKLASNEIMLVAENKMTVERFFAEAQLSEVKKRNFLKLSESQKEDILKNYSQ
jgi:hypothetical protein